MSEYVSLLHILDLNPHITKFVFKDHSCLMDNNYVLDIADFIQRLPSLRCLDVVCYCCRSLRMDCSLDGLEVLPRNLEHIRFEKCQLHTSVIEMLLLLPRLHKFSVLRCTMDDVLEAMQFIERIQYDDTIGVYPRTIQCFEFEAPHRDNPWSLGYIVALLSLMPCIKRVSLSRCNPKFVESVRQQLPHVKVNKL
ncbi:hypothetical protein GQ42DRAFT_159780 [Ramicandelaber brevisporus]|nr:hypothetical protein GQ42DRAFT_159780 [Ramicandelaber brevisporus]